MHIHGEVDADFARRVRKWALEVLEGIDTRGRSIELRLWSERKDLENFLLSEQSSLGAKGGECEDFLAMHEAWRDFPRIHICEQRVKNLPESLIKGAVQHETAHAILHGERGFYTFAFSAALRERALEEGMGFEVLQQLVYLISIALKDVDVVLWLSQRGLAEGQITLLESLMEDTKEEAQLWGMIRKDPVLERLALGALLKVFLATWALSKRGVSGAVELLHHWESAYDWLDLESLQRLRNISDAILAVERSDFQVRLERAVRIFINA